MTEPTQHNRGTAQIVSFESNALEAIAATYPAEMREPFLWLADFVRDNCARNLETLEQKLRDLKLTTTAGTISKILRGRWKTDAQKRPCPPIMALENFLAMVQKLQADPELAETADDIPFVETGTYHTIENYIDVRRAPHRICKFGFIIGPTSAQKTASLKHYQKKYPRSVTWVEAPEMPRLGGLISDLAKEFGASYYLSLQRKRIKIKEHVNAKKVLIIENVQRLYSEPDGRDLEVTGQPIFSYIQKLQDETGCTPIFTATPDFYKEFIAGIHKGYFEQFEGRMGGQHEFLILPPYTPREDVEDFARAYGLPTTDENIDYLQRVDRIRGRVRILLQTLQTAKEEAVQSGQELTLDHIKEIVPPSRLPEMKEAA